MGGKIGLSSEPFVGSLFWVELDLMPAEPPSTQGESAHPSSITHSGALAGSKLGTVHKLRGARVLVAEDNATNQRVAQLILESAGHTVTIVPNGEAALDALERSSFDVALFDLSMPQVSGLEALKLYRFSVAKPIPVIILSANVIAETIAECKAAGAADFIPKPLRAAHLLDAVERHLEKTAKQHTPPPTAKTDERPVLEVVDCPTVDKTVIDDLAKLSPDPTFVVRLIEGFFADADRLSREIVEAITNRRYELVKDVAHALKGGAGSVGAVQLVQFAKRLENASNDSIRLRSSQWIEELRLLDRQTRASLNQNVQPHRDYKTFR